MLADGKLPLDVVYVGQGHHSHRVPRSQWASPFVQGHTCTTDDWLPLYVDFVLANLQAELPALQGKRLACDCGPDSVCEADALTGMVFDATHPDAEASLPRVTGRRHRQARGSVVRAATIMGSLQGSDALKSMSLWFPQDVILAFRKLYPAEWLQSFQWPMLEDLLNKEPFTCYLDWRQSRGMEWDGPLGPPSLSNASWRRQRLAEGKQHDWPNAYRHCPMSRQEALACVVVWYHQDWQEPAFQVYHALLFGLPLAVTSFNRYSRLAGAVGRRFLAIMVSMYFDDSHITDRAVHGPSAQWSFGALNDLLGTPFAEEKRQGAADVGTFLGLDFDLSEVRTHGRARFWVRERLEQKVLTFMRDARRSGKFTPGQAAKLYGMVNFLEHGLFGRGR